jgi:spermidine synthase
VGAPVEKVNDAARDFPTALVIEDGEMGCFEFLPIEVPVLHPVLSKGHVRSIVQLGLGMGRQKGERQKHHHHAFYP